MMCSYAMMQNKLHWIIWSSGLQSMKRLTIPPKTKHKFIHAFIVYAFIKYTLYGMLLLNDAQQVALLYTSWSA